MILLLNWVLRLWETEDPDQMSSNVFHLWEAKQYLQWMDPDIVDHRAVLELSLCEEHGAEKNGGVLLNWQQCF